MPETQPPEEPRTAEDSPRFGKVVMDDLSRGDFGRTMSRDLREVYEFYLDDPTRDRLDDMGHVSRWAHLSFWLLKNSVLRLSPARRLLLLGSLLFFVEAITSPGNVAAIVIGFLVLLLILVLELKDKLLAQDELAAGRTVQLALLPTDHPSLPEWDVWLTTRPANDVGGDLVDYPHVSPDRLGVVLGDVAGKGLGAALFMAQIQATLRTLAPDRESIPDLGERLNETFFRDGLPARFASLVYLEVRPDSPTVRLLNAGHFPPVVVRQGRLEELPKGGAALGLIDSAVYEEHSVDLAPGDLLVVYSDGVTEARNEAGEFFEPERLMQVLPALRGRSAEEAGHRLLKIVDRFVENTRANDDLSLVIIRRRPHREEREERALPETRTSLLTPPA